MDELLLPLNISSEDLVPIAVLYVQGSWSTVIPCVVFRFRNDMATISGREILGVYKRNLELSLSNRDSIVQNDISSSSVQSAIVPLRWLLSGIPLVATSMFMAAIWKI